MKQSDWKKQRASSFFVFLFNDMVLVTKKPSKSTRTLSRAGSDRYVLGKLSTSRRFAVEAIINLHETHLDHGEEGNEFFHSAKFFGSQLASVGFRVSGK